MATSALLKLPEIVRPPAAVIVLLIVQGLPVLPWILLVTVIGYRPVKPACVLLAIWIGRLMVMPAELVE